jgi:uncharacterized membrane protein (UPF0127 family)
VTARDYEAPGLRKVDVVLADAFGGTHPLKVEVAEDDRSRERGLMWRTSLKDDEGMIFVFPAESVQTFWMKNTLIPLDMLFIGRDGRVVGIVERAEPKTLSPRTVGLPSLYVLEVPGGWTARMGVRAGSVVKMHGL